MMMKKMTTKTKIRRLICRLVGCQGMAYAIANVTVDRDDLRQYFDKCVAETLRDFERRGSPV